MTAKPNGAIAEMMKAEYAARTFGSGSGEFVMSQPEPMPPPPPRPRIPPPDWEQEAAESRARERAERERVTAEERRAILDSLEQEKSLGDRPAPAKTRKRWRT